MKAVFLFDIRHAANKLTSGLIAAGLLGMGIFTGSRFNLGTGDGVYLNSPYSIGFLLGMISLSVIFIATIYAASLLFKEWDSRFDPILFTTPVHKGRFALGRFLSLLTFVLISFLLITTGFAIGMQMRTGADIQPAGSVLYYLYPLIVFGGVNSLFVCSFLFFIAWKTKNKLLMAVGGLFLYVTYMVVLLFSNAPFMAQVSPQSLAVQQISALADPFGLSAYFYVSRDYSVHQRNNMLVTFSGYFLINRLIVSGISGILILLGCKGFSYTVKKYKKPAGNKHTRYLHAAPYAAADTACHLRTWLRSVRSFVKLDLIHTFKSIPFVGSVVILLFYIGMEMYGEIEKGIRIPAQYASSGLMAMAVSDNFHVIGVLLMVYFMDHLFWKSHTARFSAMENTTAHASARLWGHWCSSGLLLLCYTILTIILALIFQWGYGYFHIDWQAYAGVLVFNTCPLLLLTGLLLLINAVIRRRYFALGLSVLTALAVATPLSKKIITLPLLRFFSGFNGVYSDFNGYGVYLSSFTQRLIFGGCMVALLWIIYEWIKNGRQKKIAFVGLMVLAAAGFISGKMFMQGYKANNPDTRNKWAAHYEKNYRKYQAIPQPVVTSVKTSIALYPDKRAYTIEGSYTLKNQTKEIISKILINVDDDLKIMHAAYMSQNEAIRINDYTSALLLQRPLLPNDSARISFKLSYQWAAVNGHQPFNAIIENGSFMRISRYYPQIGYQSQYELTDEYHRKQYGLGAGTGIRQLQAPRAVTADFIDLDMTVSTAQNQRVIGTGELVKEWKNGDRNYFHYRTNEPIPFRFAVSSASYRMARTVHDGIQINVFYDPDHGENVTHLINNARLTLDYCQQNFGRYPFATITFAEVSAFTKGFAATAYPAVIFMTENMLFHADIKKDQQQDVINEMAGHELSHMWWGNNQISPDGREGAVMLTETLAMYTEMMLYKKMYGHKKMMERVKMHQQLYDAGKGFSEDQPLYKVKADNIHISYSKGAVVMVKLSELIGEKKVNEALANFLQQHKYPHASPVSTDLITEFLKVSDSKYHREIKAMFMEI